MVGLFVSADKKLGDMQGVNPYEYVGENPETNNDPTGQYFVPGGNGSGDPPPRPTNPPPQPPNTCTITSCSVTLHYGGPFQTFTTTDLLNNPQDRLTFLTIFYEVFAPGYQTAEMDFLRYLQHSGRLDEKGGYWDVVDYDLIRDALLAAYDFLQGHAAQSGAIGDWLAFLSHHSNSGWWQAHNASIDAGDQQARAAGLYSKENPVEQAFINETINVLHSIQGASRGNTPISNILGPQSPATGILTSIFYPQRSDPVTTAESLYNEGQVAVDAGEVAGAGLGFAVGGPIGAVVGAIAGGIDAGLVYFSWLLPPSQ